MLYRLLARDGSTSAVAVSGSDAADRLCARCVELLEFDGAAISLLPQGIVWGTLGGSGELSRRVDELQFTVGEGPCMDAVCNGHPVQADLSQPGESRWPAFAGAVLALGVDGPQRFGGGLDNSLSGDASRTFGPGLRCPRKLGWGRRI